MTTEHLEAGLHFNIPMERYIADPCPEPSLSKGGILSLFSSTPAHTWHNHPRLNPDHVAGDSTRADLGSAAHAAILGEDRIAYGGFSDWRTKAARAWRDEQREADKVPMLEKDKASIKAIADSATKMLEALSGGANDFQCEGTMIWQDGPTWKRGRFDIWSPEMNAIIDIKTTGSANPAAWIKITMASGGYDIQAVHYLQGLKALGKSSGDTEFFFLLVEIEPPYCCSLVGLDTEYAEAAARKIKISTKRWARCMESGEWPGYGARPHWAEMPPWELAAVEAQSYLESQKEETCQDSSSSARKGSLWG